MNRRISVMSMIVFLAGSAVAFAQGNSKKGSSAISAPVLALDQFLDQVRSKHQGYEAAEQIARGASERSEEGSLAFRPTLVGSATFSKDERESFLFAVPGTQNAYSLGISQATRFGLQAKLSYNLNSANLSSSTFGTISGVTAGPVLELTFPLLRNRFSSELKALETAQNSAALATSFGSAFAAKQILADAESAYWRLALARELVALTQETLTRAQKILAWNSRRAKLELTDRSDLLQADASVLSRQQDLRVARDEERAASRAFNSARGLDADVVQESLAAISPEIMDHLAKPVLGGQREDLLAAEQQQKAAAATARRGQEVNKPSVDLFATFGLNGLDTATSAAVSESFTTQFPNRSVGVRMIMPLDFGTTSDIRVGYAREQAAADMNYERRAFEEKRLWDDLSIRFDDTRARLKLARQLEDAQRQKLEYERQKLNRGRTTTYQVLLFEQDFIAAQLSRVRTQSDLMNIIAQMKTFASNKGNSAKGNSP